MQLCLVRASWICSFLLCSIWSNFRPVINWVPDKLRPDRTLTLLTGTISFLRKVKLKIRDSTHCVRSKLLCSVENRRFQSRLLPWSFFYPQGLPETCGIAGQANNLAPPQTDILEIFFGQGQGWRKFLRACAQIADNFRKKKSLAGGKLSLLAKYCR